MSTDLWPGHCMIDPSEMESRFSSQDSMQFMDSIFEEPSTESRNMVLRIRRILDQLPSREADFVDLYYFYKLKQTAIAQIFNCSQPTVCYRLQRAASRIQFLLSLPDITAEEVEEGMTSLLSSKVDIQIMVLMFKTTCQSEAAKQLGISQGKVRHRFIRTLNKMRKQPDMVEFVTLFEQISNNLNILREVCRTPTEDTILYIVD